jgi:hypothetical protein
MHSMSIIFGHTMHKSVIYLLEKGNDLYLGSGHANFLIIGGQCFNVRYYLTLFFRFWPRNERYREYSLPLLRPVVLI